MGSLLLFAALFFGHPGPAVGAVVPLRATLEGGTFLPFSQTNAAQGVLKTTTARAYRGAWSAHATYDGSTVNGYSRGIFNVRWREGDDVWYRSAFFLPVGFRAAMQGQVALMRWDDWQSHPHRTDHGGIVIFGGDKRAYLVKERLGRDDQTPLLPAFDLPEGRWFMLEVHQRFASTSGPALNEVYLDGRLVGRSTTANIDAGRPVERIRYGIVAVASGSQTQPLSLYFDDAAVDTTGPYVPSILGGVLSHRSAE